MWSTWLLLVGDRVLITTVAAAVAADFALVSRVLLRALQSL
jgi:hypothetical protein